MNGADGAAPAPGPARAHSGVEAAGHEAAGAGETVGQEAVQRAEPAAEPDLEQGADGVLQQTAVAPPRQRVFLPRTRGEGVAEVLWGVVRMTLFRWSPPSLHRWRVALLRLFRANVAWDVRIEPSAVVHHPWRLTIGPGAIIAHKVVLDCMGEIVIGAGTRVSQYSHLCAGTHEYTRPDMQILKLPIRVGSGVWIAADAFIGPNVTIGDRSIVAARSSVFHSLPAGVVATGEPAVVRRERPPMKGR